jgi:hypothetical protein
MGRRGRQRRSLGIRYEKVRRLAGQKRNGEAPDAAIRCGTAREEQRNGKSR